MTLTAVIERVLGKKIEKPVQQYEALIQSGGALRRRFVVVHDGEVPHEA